MSNPPARSLFKQIFINFINSLKPRRFTGDLQGTDYLGNKYYEIPADSSLNRRRSRYFEPPKEKDFDHEMPSEWESWLRGRRRDPPSEEEVMRNYAIMQIKKKNAREIDGKGGQKTPMTKGIETFPQRPEYEMVPGKKKEEE